jgi:hypothetical protein
MLRAVKVARRPELNRLGQLGRVSPQQRKLFLRAQHQGADSVEEEAQVLNRLLARPGQAGFAAGCVRAHVRCSGGCAPGRAAVRAGAPSLGRRHEAAAGRAIRPGLAARRPARAARPGALPGRKIAPGELPAPCPQRRAKKRVSFRPGE